MHHLPRITLFLLAGAAGVIAAADFEEARQSITAEEIRAHLYFLSLDDLQGRGPGTPGGQLAGGFIASQFRRIGLEPVDGSYFQAVPVTGVTIDPESVALTFEAGDDRLPSAYGRDAVIWPGGPEPTTEVEADVVFVGYGAEAPRWGWDDYKGRDLSGKILVFLVGDPPAPPDEPELFDGRAMTYYGRWTYKLQQARRRGAAGALIVHTSDAAGYGWDVVRSSWTGEQLALDHDDDDPLPLQGWITRDFARRIFAMSGLDLDELYVSATRRDFRPVNTGIRVRARMVSQARSLGTRNVVGFLPGSHPERREEVVVLTAHYDHLGIGEPVAGDSVYNGAYDNASGVALLLEVADAFARLEPRPDRSVLFIATDAEEAGLLGSQHYVRNPLFPLDRTVAALNVDGANLWGETEEVIALGAERSTLGDLLGGRLEEVGLTVRPDPAPESGAFFRSDHLPFARAGVPVLYLRHGLRFRGRPEGWGERLLADYQQRHYHRPSDEYRADFDLSGAVQQGRLLFSVAYDVATADSAPRWHEGEEAELTVPSAGR